MINSNKDFVKIWGLLNGNKSNSLSHQTVLKAIENLLPTENAQEILNILHTEGLVTVDTSGNYILTSQGVKIRKLYPDNLDFSRPVPPQNKSIHNWERFRQLLSYYIDCVHTQERSQQYLFESDVGIKFFKPTAIDHNWLKSLNEKDDGLIEILYHHKKDALAIHPLTAKSDEDEEIYIGYPIEAFKDKKGNWCYTPIGLIPIDIEEITESSLKVKLRLDETEINQTWLDFSVREEIREKFINVSLNFHKEGEFKGLFDLKKTLNLIPTYSKFKGVDLNPNDTAKVALPIKGEGEPGLYNIPLVFLGSSLKFSKTLKRELKYIRDKVSDDDLDKTALAYVFRDPPLQNVQAESISAPLDFIPSNEEQRNAVYAALNFPISKVTGPPGTGKTQVAINIISNYIYNNKSILFTSMNHKAVHAIEKRISTVLGDNSFPLVNFCSNEDNSTQNPWFKQDIDMYIAQASSLIDSGSDIDEEYVDESAKDWVRFSERYGERANITNRLSTLERRYENTLNSLKRILKNKEFIRNEYNLKELAKLRQKLAKDKTFKWSQLFSYLYWKFFQKNDSKESKECLLSIIPSLKNRINFDDFAEGISDFISKINDFDEIENLIGKLKLEIAQLPEMRDGIDELKSCLDTISKYLISAFKRRLSKKISALSYNHSELNKLKDIKVMLKSSNSPYFFQRIDRQTYADAKSGFSIFSKYFPAWAATLLSLSKASPCIPALFDRVVIDEASQVQIPAIIPALFRSKSVTVIGDPNQFPPVYNISNSRHDYLKSKHKMTTMECQHFDFMAYNAYSLLNSTPIILKEHFRCNLDIVEYFNETFYNNKLITRTDTKNLKFPVGLGYKKGLEWVDIIDNADAEIEEVLVRLKQLKENNYKGSIGVITPLRTTANLLKEKLYNEGFSNIDVNTANGFQGGEKDLIIFVLGYTSKLTKGQKWYLESLENRYLYNVAISRARACILVIGDKTACKKSKVIALENLAQFPKLENVSNTAKCETVLEQKLYDVLLLEGIETKPQYPVSGRRLDLGYIDSKNKIDIEVDGKKYHINSYGERKIDDYYRDLQLESLGWKVIRFWAYEVRDDIGHCVEIIKNSITK